MKNSMKVGLIAAFLFCQAPSGFSGWKIVSKPRKLAGGAGDFYLRPVWSPNGEWIAFTTPAYRGVWVKNPRSNELKQISEQPAAGFGFSWSNSGEAIAARVAKYDGVRRRDELQIIDIPGGGSRTLSHTGSRLRGLSRWSSDDSVVYIQGASQLEAFDSLIGKGALARPDLSTSIFYLKAGKIGVFTAEPQSGRTIDPLEGQRCINLAVSPDRSKLAFEAVGGDLHVMNADGTGLVNLGRGFRPQWSPDSDYLVFMVSDDDGHDFTHSDIFIIKADGAEISRLTDTSGAIEMNPSWSPDGTQIAFDSYKSGEIYLVAVEKGKEK